MKEGRKEQTQQSITHPGIWFACGALVFFFFACVCVCPMGGLPCPKRFCGNSMSARTIDSFHSIPFSRKQSEKEASRWGEAQQDIASCKSFASTVASPRFFGGQAGLVIENE